MLYAELHGKLDPNAANLERSEDILTSTTFGTLLIAGAQDSLTKWVKLACHLGPEGALDDKSLDKIGGPVSCWFWPNLTEAIPDVLLRIGSALFVIEAKYGSSKGGAGGDGSDLAQPADQLLREWSAIQATAQKLEWYRPDIRDAIEKCEHHLVYLVSARSRQSALTELRESQRRIRMTDLPDASLWLLTWQDLHKVLKLEEVGQPAAHAWVGELARLLDERRHLGAFLGFAHVLVAGKALSDSGEIWARQWRSGSRGIVARYFDGIGRLDLDAIRNIVASKWGSRFGKLRKDIRTND